MSFKTASAIVRGAWLLDKSWAQDHMPLVVSVINGKGSFKEIFGDEKEEEIGKAAEPIKVLSHSASVYRVSAYTDLSKLPNDSIAMINIIGPVMKYGDFCSWGAADHANTINRLGNSPNIAGILLNIDSPGGQVSGTSLLADAIKSVSARKPIVAVIDDGIAASAAMWIASAANEIYVTKKHDQVGSIGVYTTIADWYGYFEKEGLKVRDVYAPQSTDKNGDYREAIAGNEEPLKEDLAIIAGEFISTIKTNRAGKLTSDKWNTGRMFYGKEAKQIGLIDGIKSFDQVVKRMDQMVSDKKQKTNSYNMAFEKTLATANAEAFEVVEGGFLLTEEHLNSIEATLATNSELAIVATQAEARNSELIIAHGEEVTQLNASIAAKDTEIANLNAKITELENQTPEAAQTSKEADETGGKNVKKESAMDAFADSLLGKPKQA